MLVSGIDLSSYGMNQMVFLVNENEAKYPEKSCSVTLGRETGHTWGILCDLQGTEAIQLDESNRERPLCCTRVIT